MDCQHCLHTQQQSGWFVARWSLPPTISTILWNFSIKGTNMLRRTWTGEELPYPVYHEKSSRYLHYNCFLFRFFFAYKSMALNMFCRVAELISDEFVGQIGETIKRDASHSSTRELDASAMRRNFPNSSVEAMTSHRIQSPMRRSSFVGLNMICDQKRTKKGNQSHSTWLVDSCF